MDAYSLLWMSFCMFFALTTAGATWLWIRQIQQGQATMEQQQQTHQQQMNSLLRTQAESTSLLSQQETQRQLQLLHLAEKGMALAASGDPLAFQAIQAMEPTPSAYDGEYDPSDEGEIERIMSRQPRLQEDDLSGYERDALLELGIDAAFLDDGAGRPAD